MSIYSRVSVAAIACVVLSAASSQASAKVKVDVDLDTQTMHVQGKDKSFDTKVSSGKAGYETPAGSFKVLWMDKDHHSDTYDGAYMPNAVFFAPGYAIHGFGKSPWGHKASHGCIRVPVARSAELFEMVKAEGGADITVTGASNVVAPTVAQAEARARAKAGAQEAETSSEVRERAYADETPYAGYGRRRRVDADQDYYAREPRVYGQRGGNPSLRSYLRDGYDYPPAYGYDSGPYGSNY